jgi:hypothetical protein
VSVSVSPKLAHAPAVRRTGCVAGEQPRAAASAPADERRRGTGGRRVLSLVVTPEDAKDVARVNHHDSMKRELRRPAPARPGDQDREARPPRRRPLQVHRRRGRDPVLGEGLHVAFWCGAGCRKGPRPEEQDPERLHLLGPHQAAPSRERSAGRPRARVGALPRPCRDAGEGGRDRGEPGQGGRCARQARASDREAGRVARRGRARPRSGCPTNP